MEELWIDPLLLTDASSQQQHYPNYTDAAMSSRSNNSPLPDSDSDSSPQINSDDTWPNQSSNQISTPIREFDGRSMLGFSLTSPDLVICTGSPDIPANSYGDSPEFSEKHRCSIELSLENGIDGSDTKLKHKTPTVKFSTVCQTFDKELSPDSSFELLPLPETADYRQKEDEHLPVISINAGCLNGAVELDGVIYSDDNCYVGGDFIRTDSMIGDGMGNSLYNTARFGDFSYKFLALESGFYTVDLHFAEIAFTSGPPGIRVFDVFIQEEKVVSSLDIYGQVGANKPLVISNIRTFVDSGGGLLIRFEGLIRSPIVCGITVMKDSPASFKEAASEEVMGMAKWGSHESPRDISDHQKLRREPNNDTDAAMSSRSNNPPLPHLDSDSSPQINSDDPWPNQSSNQISTPIREFDGRSMLGFSLTSPDLVICTGSPDIPANSYGDSPEFLEKNRYSIELPLENGIDGSVECIRFRFISKEVHQQCSSKGEC